jgi:hypothetical protein
MKFSPLALGAVIAAIAIIWATVATASSKVELFWMASMVVLLFLGMVDYTVNKFPATRPSPERAPVTAHDAHSGSCTPPQPI